MKSFILPLLVLGILATPAAYADYDHSDTRVALITCGPGDDLYAVFGHSAIQIYNPDQGIDRVYNYGTFDFDTPNFYLKFAQGRLEYALAVSTLDYFMATYYYEGRWVKRQWLNLETEEVEALYHFLEHNALPENRYYAYDFFYDNCSSRIRDVFEEVLGERLHYPNGDKDTTATFRQMIDLYLTAHPWSDLGIDLALGVPCDARAGFREKMFLPDYLMDAMGQALLLRDGEKSPFVAKTETLLEENPKLRSAEESSITWLFWCFFGFCLLASIFVSPERLRWFDFGFFLIIGLLSIAILLLWFATDHSATKWNMNILWALPTWLYAAYLILRKRTESSFFKYHSAVLFFVMIAWMWIPQSLNTAVIPLVLALITRCWSWQKQIFRNENAVQASPE